ncbi:MAG: glycosyltransferase family 4 protein [Magnetococcales bacterium]|nr:glycosyltransferase family 4 protein [Nitrospirota bacterium]
MINVLYLRQASGSVGGADTVILNTIEAMKGSDINIIPVYLKKYNEDVSAISCRVSEIGAASFYDVAGRLPVDPLQLLQIGRIIRRHKVRIIHCHEYKSDILGYLIGHLFPTVKLISTVHGWIETRKRSRYYIKLDRVVLRRFDAVIVVSSDILRVCQDSGIDRLHLLRNCVDTSKWSASEDEMPGDRPATPFSVGFVGRISMEKGPLDFVYTASRVLQEYPDTEFYVAGTGQELHKMKTCAIEAGVIGRFHFLGYLNEQQLNKLYQQLDVVLLTSYTEGIPLTILEACAMGVVVVATEVGGVGEVIEHGVNGLLTRAGDVQALASAIISLRQDNALFKRLKDNGRNIVQQHFSSQSYAVKLQDVYEGIL